MAEHSPLPWRVAPYEGHVSAENGRLIAGCRGYESNVDARVDYENDANARYIVTAANNHQRLVDALKAARPCVAVSAEASHFLEGFTIGDDGLPCSNRSETAEDRRLQMVDAALAEVEATHD